MKNRIYFFYILLIASFSIIFIRLFYLQIIRGKENRLLAQNNRIKIIPLIAPRGIIYDRNNQILARNRPEGREYLFPKAFSHVLGYVGEVSQEELNKDQSRKMGEVIGKMGLEQTYDKVLRGKDGGILVETNALGEPIREIKRTEPKEGQSLVTTLDAGLQQKASSLLEDKKGAVIATTLNGEVLALVSSPGFDANLFTLPGKNNQKLLEDIFSNPNQPLFNRAIGGLYPPGSTFKIVTAMAGLQEEKINSAILIEDTGEISAGGRKFGNWYFSQYGKKEGMLNIIKAFKRSNDIYFYKTGEMTGIDKLAWWARNFGLGEVLGIDILGEAKGLVPTPEWKKEQKLEGWYLGDTYITAIGQGNLQLTPLQVNHVTSIIAANAMSCKPHLILSSEQSCSKLNIDQKNINLIKEGMKEACSEGGTGWPFFDFKPQVACKTGTAEIGIDITKTHAWFTVFAPLENPSIVLTVLVESGGEGSTVAGPIAKELLKYWFSRS